MYDPTKVFVWRAAQVSARVRVLSCPCGSSHLVYGGEHVLV